MKSVIEGFLAIIQEKEKEISELKWENIKLESEADKLSAELEKAKK